MSPWSGFRDPTCESDPPSLVGDLSTEEELESPVWPEPDVLIETPQHIQDPCYFGIEVDTDE